MLDAEVCRELGWGPGTVLRCPDSYGGLYAKVEILCVGQQQVFFRVLEHKPPGRIRGVGLEHCSLYELGGYEVVK